MSTTTTNKKSQTNAAHKAWETRRAKAAAKAEQYLQQAHTVAKKANETISKASQAAHKAWETRRANNQKTTKLPFETLEELYVAVSEGAINMPSFASAVHMVYDDERMREDVFEMLAAVITAYFNIPDNVLENCSDWQIVEAMNNPANPVWVGHFDELPTLTDYIRICRLSNA